VANNPSQIITRRQPTRCVDLFALHTTESNWQTFCPDDSVLEELAGSGGAGGGGALFPTEVFQRVTSLAQHDPDAEKLRERALDMLQDVDQRRGGLAEGVNQMTEDVNQMTTDEAYQEMLVELQEVNANIAGQNARAMTSEWKEMQRFVFVCVY
jgi:hypothetical protein